MLGAVKIKTGNDIGTYRSNTGIYLQYSTECLGHRYQNVLSLYFFNRPLFFFFFIIINNIHVGCFVFRNNFLLIFSTTDSIINTIYHYIGIYIIIMYVRHKACSTRYIYVIIGTTLCIDNNNLYTYTRNCYHYRTNVQY